ncbi:MULTISPECIES: hypothetical protein [Flavobacterium]|jgi:hypothetical protein|uniref:Uncharacterized protein n=1 Tax=Flavobacterium algoritolerans TaxID=3041254 RepID=A0ABT6VDQ7_9FLAO|nr:MULTISPECIES: hypothetical protein [Flavobacterium]MDI5896370.1 hypothetical protein [Flavobacterium algoritolerans]PIF60825.1 hypothetical protein CLV00_0355 [Flavobacterium sp. 11]RKS13179.1 hypothetical protein C8C87_0382 [Flavobacterium sp. 120]WKL45210.1 hypothetical protein Q1W72_06250 [Flavobacterium sp. ZE23DGlu08]
MKTNIKYILGLFIVALTFISCNEEEYSLGELSAPANVVINAEVVGVDATHPNGDGSGSVKISVTGDNALSYKIDYDASTPLDLVYLPTGKATKKYTSVGVNTYRITVVAYGKGGSSTNVTKDVTVRSDFTVAPEIVTALTNNASKRWVVDKSVAGHLGVGPWNVASIRPEWWAGGVNEKVASANCFYTATFTFAKVAASGTYSLQVTTPDGAFTKTGSLTTLPGIPGSGDEGCYNYGGGTSAFSFVPASSGAPVVVTNADNSTSTQTSILLSGVDTFIGYGAVQKEYEILVITSTYMYLRVQGTETGNAWYLKLKPAL